MTQEVANFKQNRGFSKRGNFPAFLPSRNGNSQAELKEFIAKRRSFGGTRCIWCKAPIWGLPILLTVDGPGSTKQYQSWVYIAVFWVSSTQTHRHIRQDLYECAWCFMWGLANTFFCLEALIYKKHRKTSQHFAFEPWTSSHKNSAYFHIAWQIVCLLTAH